MSQTFQCGDNTALVSYLYDECDAAERHAIDAHLALCAACAAELAALESTRRHLASWAPPEADLGFQIVRPHPSTIARGALAPHRARVRGGDPALSEVEGQAWLRQPLPAWAQAAAALLIFAAGLSLGIVRGTAPDADVTRGAVASAPAPVTTPVSASDLAALERRLRTEISRIRAAAPTTTVAAPDASESQVLARVRALIEESEQRQQRELALRTAQVVREFESQRRVDLAQIQRTFGQMEGITGAQVREQRDVLNYLMRVSQQQR